MRVHHQPTVSTQVILSHPSDLTPASSDANARAHHLHAPPEERYKLPGGINEV